MAGGNRRKNSSALAFGVSLGWCLISAVLLYSYPHLLEGINLKVYDWKLSLWSAPEPYHLIVHLDVDDEAVKQYGQWPWDRSMSARIVDRLSEMGAKVVIFDILYVSQGKSQEGDEAFFASIKRAGNVITASGLGVATKKGDRLEVDSDTSRADALYDASWVLSVPEAIQFLRVNRLKNSFLPLLPIIQDSRGIGHIRGVPDADGVYRRIPLFVNLEDRYVPSLTMAALREYLGLSPENIIVTGKGAIETKRDGLTTSIPVDSQGMMLIHWGKIWESFRHYTVGDVLSDNPDKSRISRYKDKIVIVGVLATGSTDFGVSPVSIHTPLNRIYSFSLSTILTKNFIVQIPTFPNVFLVAVALGIMFAFVGPRLRLKLGILIATFICVFGFIVSVVFFSLWSYEVPVAEFFLVFVPAAFGCLFIRATTMELQAARTSKALERYLSPQLLETVVNQLTEIDLTTKRIELTVVFVDIEKFSSVFETVEVEYINRFLNAFFETMANAIFQYSGTIDKFLGDGLLAFFGDPIPMENHAQAAVMASLEMQRQMYKLSSQWSKSGITALGDGVRMRIGISTGIVVVGNVGSVRRMEYTVLGSVVNIASRLQSLAPPGGVVMTARTRSFLQEDLKCHGPDFVRVKNIDKGIEVFTIFPEDIA